jgi:N-acetylglucosaminyldiphosphoundecaprenol N-acetyl-beta-D-mannosaminyltransferase
MGFLSPDADGEEQRETKVVQGNCCMMRNRMLMFFNCKAVQTNIPHRLLFGMHGTLPSPDYQGLTEEIFVLAMSASEAIPLPVESKRLEASHFTLLGVPVTATTMSAAIARVRSWIENGDRGRTVTFATVHMLVEGLRNPGMLRLLSRTDMNCPDGMPLVWYGRRRAAAPVERVCGPDFLPAFCAATQDMNLRHYFYGGAEGIAEKAAAELQRMHPGVEIAGAFSPPFRALTADEKDQIACTINAARPDVVWVSLGCPKQELWIDEFRSRLDAPVLLAVGLAVDIAAGAKGRAPAPLRTLGLEWLFRLCQEPRRLWRRYLVYNSIFLYHLLAEMLEAGPGRRPAQ